MNTQPPDLPAQPKISTATVQLLSVAATIPALARIMGLEIRGACHMVLTPGFPRPWMVEHPLRAGEWQFDPDRFFDRIKFMSGAEFACGIFLLNVWNPAEASIKKRLQFDLFHALKSLDEGNRHGIARWLTNPIWP
jgi:hypothetical protein